MMITNYLLTRDRSTSYNQSSNLEGHTREQPLGANGDPRGMYLEWGTP
jgi:hypothetical protein